jgi:hypothetical protein
MKDRAIMMLTMTTNERTTNAVISLLRGSIIRCIPSFNEQKSQQKGDNDKKSDNLLPEIFAVEKVPDQDEQDVGKHERV